ncbi:MAG: Glycosyl transferase family 39, partial [uncultured bacterium]
MHLFKQLWLPFLILTVPAVIFSLFLPYFPVDETRYLSVAWEMRLHDSFIVPLQNALPYSHKPPLLFWLFNLNWLLFGVNESTLRFIPLLFSLLNVSLVFRIALLLWEDERIARHAAIILSSTLSYLLWSSFIMFDVVLTTWVLLALLGLISAARWHSIKWWLLVGFS